MLVNLFVLCQVRPSCGCLGPCWEVCRSPVEDQSMQQIRVKRFMGNE